MAQLTKEGTQRHFDRHAPEMLRWQERNTHYHRHLRALVRRFVPPGRRVLELGSGLGDLLAAVRPARGVGIDLSHDVVETARRRHPNLDFSQGDADAPELGETFDYVILSDVIGYLHNIWGCLRRVHAVAEPHTRLILTFHNALWEPLIVLAERFGLKMPTSAQNWLGMDDVQNLLTLADFAVVRQGTSFIFPFDIPIVAPLLNALLPQLPGVRHLCLVQWVVARPVNVAPGPERSVTVVIPTRNEIGNIRSAVARVPEMGTGTEIIFVDGASTDGTVEEIEAVIREHPDRPIRLIHQVTAEAAASESAAANDAPVAKQKMLRLGKGDAVRKGFAAATGDVLMILDADLTVPPEDLPRFYYAIRDGKGEMINGTRLVYPMEDEAMQPVNLLGNKFFSVLFTWLLGQQIKDTLCGTKVLAREDYRRIVENRAYFGDFDPFGDFDLLFGAARQKMLIVDVPVRYRRRVTGYSKVEAYKHGMLLARMSAIAFQRFKIAPFVNREK